MEDMIRMQIEAKDYDWNNISVLLTEMLEERKKEIWTEGELFAIKKLEEISKAIFDRGEDINPEKIELIVEETKDDYDYSPGFVDDNICSEDYEYEDYPEDCEPPNHP